LRSALVQVLRELGLLSKVVPTDLALIALAKDFAEKGKGLVTDDGQPVGFLKREFKFSECLGSPSPLDEEIPF